MNKTAVKKIILLSLIAVLLVVYLFQIALTGRSSSKTFSLKDEITEITVKPGSGSELVIKKLEAGFEVGNASDQKFYKASETSAQALFDAMSEIKVVGTASSSVGNNAERYGLDEASKITVTAKTAGSTRVLTVGKNTTAGSQSYVLVDDSQAVQIANATLHTLFSCTLDSLRDKTVYSFDSQGIVSVRVSGEEPFEITRSVNTVTPSAEDETAASSVKWNLFVNGENAEGDFSQEQINAWAISLASLSASSWADENVNLFEYEKVSQVDITTSAAVCSVKVFAIPDDEERFICTSSLCEYPFYLSKYTASRFIKKISEFKSQQ